MSSSQSLSQLIQKNASKWVDLRQQFHLNPELAFEEWRTRRKILSLFTTNENIPIDITDEKIRELSLKPGVKQILPVATTGLLIDLGSTDETYVDHMIAFRCDMDALPMIEGNLNLPYRSLAEHRAHACGHDGHMASLLFAGEILRTAAALNLFPPGTALRLICQPAEEIAQGARKVVSEGGVDKPVVEVYGLHNWPHGKFGHLYTMAGPVMAHGTQFEIRVKGKGGHGSQPSLANNPISCIAGLITEIETSTRNLRCMTTLNDGERFPPILSICQMQSGEAPNVIPDVAILRGTTRDLDSTAHEPMGFGGLKSTLETIIEKFRNEFKCQIELRWLCDAPTVVNWPTETSHVLRVARKTFGEAEVVTSGDTENFLPVMASEDFSEFLVKTEKGCFFFLGGDLLQAEGESQPPMLHHPDFNFPDSLVAKAAKFWVRLAEDRLGKVLFSE